MPVKFKVWEDVLNFENFIWTGFDTNEVKNVECKMSLASIASFLYSVYQHQLLKTRLFQGSSEYASNFPWRESHRSQAVQDEFKSSAAGKPSFANGIPWAF